MDIQTALYFGENYDGERNYVVLSKGHGCVALYAVFAHLERIKWEKLATFSQPGLRLTGMANSAVLGIDAPTGSLGMVVDFAVGQALASER